MGRKTGFLISKILELLATLILVSLLTFVAFSVIPGDTAQVILGPDASQAQLDALRAELGLDKPLIVQYLNWLLGLFTFNLGKSAAFGVPVSGLIAERLPVTIGMSIIALIFVIGISYPLSILSARRPGKILDQVFSVLGHVLFAIPPFVLSLLSIIAATALFSGFRAGQYYRPEDDFAGFVGCLMLPSFCIALPKIAMTFKYMRSSIIEQSSSEYVKNAKGHGLTDLRIMMRHILPNSNVSAITVISIVLSDILAGSLIVEQVFNLPGLGRLLLAGIARRDFPLLSGMVFYIAFITVLLYFTADILGSIADPRIRLK
ncbi:MAG: ABC transporter permease [Clostridiales bacterium]|nr:ABC transporter permease [Clostridiales bacterium]